MTDQILERIIYNDQKLVLMSEPLNQYLNTLAWLYGFKLQSTACWRGYVGLWKIIDDKLFLIKIDGEGYKIDVEYLNNEKLKLKEQLKKKQITSADYQKLYKKLKNQVTDNKKEFPLSLKQLFGVQRKVHANWFTGELKLGKGKLLNSWGLGFDSIYKENIFLDVQEGVIVNKRSTINT